MDDFCLPDAAAAQLTYHLRMAVAFAAAEDLAESASETTLAWTILAMYDQRESEFIAELPSPGVTAATEAQWNALRHRTEALARALQAHFVSEGQHAMAALYATAEAAVGDAVGTLRDRR